MSGLYSFAAHMDALHQIKNLKIPLGRRDGELNVNVMTTMRSMTAVMTGHKAVL